MGPGRLVLAALAPGWDHVHEDPFAMIVFPLALFVGFVSLLGYFVVVWMRQRPSDQAAQPLSLLVAEQVARRLLRIQLIVIGFLVASAAALIANKLDPIGWFLAVLVYPAILDAMISRGVLRRIDQPDAIAELRGDVIVVRSGRRTARLATSARALDRARQSGLPRTTAR